MVKAIGIRDFRGNYTRFVLTVISLFLLVVLTPLATASVHRRRHHRLPQRAMGKVTTAIVRSQRQAIVKMTIENSTLLSPSSANGSIGAAAFLLTSGRFSTDSSAEPSFVLDFVMVNSTVKALTTTPSGSAYAMRFANVSLAESSIAVVGCTIEASTNGSAFVTSSGGGLRMDIRKREHKRLYNNNNRYCLEE